MSPKKGRPTDEPKTQRESFRLSDNDMKKIKFCMDNSNMSKTDVIRKGIDMVYQSNKKGVENGL